MSPEDERARRIIRGPEKSAWPLCRDVDFARDRNLVVRAGAGSGKTTALVDRIVALLRSGEAPGKIAAITFTSKAAAELRYRLHTRIREVAEEVRVQRDESVGETRGEYDSELSAISEASADLDDLFVDTIHAFCGRILREHPFEAGLPPDFVQLDDFRERELRRRFWNGYLSEETGDGADWSSRLRQADLDPEELFEFFGDRSEHPDLELVLSEEPPPDLAAVIGELKAYLAHLEPRMPRPGPQSDGLRLSLWRLARNLDELDPVAVATWRRASGERYPLAVRAVLAADGMISGDGSKPKAVKKSLWGDRGTAERALVDALVPAPKAEQAGSLATFVVASVRPVAWAVLAWRHAEAARFVTAAVEAYAAFRRQQGGQTFQDLLIEAARLLRENPGVLRYQQAAITRMLVDEFQDTDPVQAEVLFRLAAHEHADDWQDSVPRPGSLFVVGDDKQSIYRFRRADVRVFDQVAARIEETGGEILPLRANFRSDARLCAFVNEALEPAFEASGAPYQAPWQPLEAEKPGGEHRHAVVILPVPSVRGATAKAIAEAESVEIARCIRALHEGRSLVLGGEEPLELASEGMELSEMLVLIRAAGQMPVYLRALDREGIPYEVAGGKSLSEEPAVEALATLLEAAFRPDDPVALAAALRGPLVGLSDEDLYQYVQGGGGFTLAEFPPESLPDVADGWSLIRRVRERFVTLPPAQALLMVLHEEHRLAVLGSDRDGATSAGAMLRLQALAQTVEDAGGSWSEWMHELRRLLAGELKADGMSFAAGTPAVRLMTVHQAKGLQADVVFLAQPARSTNHEPSLHVERGRGAARLHLPVSHRRSVIATPPGWTQTKLEEQRYSEAEETRLAYVASTRARKLMIVSRYESHDEGSWKPLYHALDARRAPVLGAQEARLRAEVDSQARMSALSKTRAVLTALAAPGYVRSTASALGHADEDHVRSQTGPGKGRGGESFGAEFGRAVHRMLELLVIHRGRILLGAALDATISRLLDEESPALVAAEKKRRLERARAIDEAFRLSAHWDPLCRADRVLVEVPFGRRLEDVEGLPVLLSGTIDLAFRLKGAWHIVDYKTDGGEPDAIASQYRGQVELYAREWVAMTGEPVRSAEIWLARPRGE